MLTFTLLAASFLTAPTASGAGSISQPTGPDTFALRAKSVHVGDGTVVANGVVVIKDGVIQSVGNAAPDGVEVLDVDGQIAPGFIGLREGTGVGSENNESTRKLTPTADVARAFNPEHPSWKHLVSQGFTAVVVTPSSSRIAGGTAAVVSPATGAILKRRAMVSLGMSSRSLSTSVEPTSYAGLYGHLEKAFAEAGDKSPLAMAKAGTMPVLIEAVNRAEVMNAAQFAKGHGLKGAILGATRSSDLVDVIKDAGLSVVFEPISAGSSRQVHESALSLEKAGIPFAFTADANRRGPSAMRMTAAAFMRAGLAPKTALTAMTKNAADIAGVGKTHGTIAKGKSADLVVWSGDPTDLTSRVLHVFAAGSHVHDASAGDAR